MALMALSCYSFRVRWPDANLSRAYSIASSKLEVPVAKLTTSQAAAGWVMTRHYECGTGDYRRIQIPRFFGNFGACAVSVHQPLFPREPGSEARIKEEGLGYRKTD